MGSELGTAITMKSTANTITNKSIPLRFLALEALRLTGFESTLCSQKQEAVLETHLHSILEANYHAIPLDEQTLRD